MDPKSESNGVAIAFLALCVTGAGTPSTGRNDLLPDLKIEQVPIAQLQRAEYPVRTTSNRQIVRIKSSIQKFGNVIPVVIGPDGEIIDGHTIIDAARAHVQKTVPCICIDHLAGHEIRALRIALKKIQETGTWDEQALKLDLSYQFELKTDLTVLGFEPPEIDSLLEISAANDDEVDPVDEIYDLPSPDALAVTEPGDIWILGEHLLCCGNGRDISTIQNLFGPTAAELVFTDPPFNLKVNGHVRVAAKSFKEFAEASDEMSKEEFTEFLASFLAVAKEVT